MNVLFPVLVTFFAAWGPALHRLCRHERSSGHQPHAHHFPAHGPLHGGGHRPFVRCAGQCRLGLYLP